MDYSMPGLNGTKITRVINRNYRYTKVIAVSFHDDNKVIEEMIYAGAHGYIQKSELNTTVLQEYLLNSKKYLMTN